MRYERKIERRITARHRKALQLCGDVAGKRILDIGCSMGAFESLALEGKPAEAFGIDLDEKDLMLARENVPLAKFKAGSALELPFEKNCFDIIVMLDVIEHLPAGSEAKALLEINRVLKKGGRLLVSTPNNNLLSNALDPAFLMGHRHYNAVQLEKMLAESGFAVRRVETAGAFYELLAMLLYYPFKNLLRMEIPLKGFFDRKRDLEYLHKKGFVTLYILAEKQG